MDVDDRSAARMKRVVNFDFFRDQRDRKRSRESANASASHPNLTRVSGDIIPGNNVVGSASEPVTLSLSGKYYVMSWIPTLRLAHHPETTTPFQSARPHSSGVPGLRNSTVCQGEITIRRVLASKRVTSDTSQRTRRRHQPYFNFYPM
jgi:hypothetical protein